MSSFIDYIRDSKDYANYIAIGFCIVGIIFAVIMIIIMAFADSQKVKKLMPKSIGVAERNIHDLKTAFDLLYVEKIPIISGWLADILQDLNLIKTGPIISSFFKIMRIIKRSTFEKNWRYILPWYMVIGPKSSGKSVLLDGLQFMNLPGEEKNHEDTWRLFDNSILFEVPSNTFFTESVEFWNFLCKLFKYFRPRRPLDGIILTISADSLIENAIELSNIARETAYKISSAQNLLNMKLPIYIIITNADKIKCFADFCSELSLSEKNQIIGWTAENDYEKIIPNNWLESFEKSIHIGLRKAALSFASKKKISEVLNKAIFAQLGVDQILPGLENYITTLTKSKDKILSLFVRGIYFSAISHEKISAVPIVQASILNPNSDTIKMLSDKQNIPNGVCFIDDLFRDKILAESNLATPINENKYKVDKITWIKRGTFISFSIIWVIGWYNASKIISKEFRSSELILKNAVNLMKRINIIETEIKDKSDQQIMNNEIRHMFQLLSNIKKQDMFSVFVPASWFSNISDRIASSIGIIFDSSATKAIFLNLNLNAKNISLETENEILNTKFISNKINPFDIDSLPSFIGFKKYISEIQRLEKLEGEYNRLRKLEDPEALNTITKEIFRETFTVVNSLNDRTISSKFIAPQFELDEFRDQIYMNLKNLFNKFLAEIFDKTIEKIFEKLCEDIAVFAASTQNPKEIYSAENLSKLNAKILKIIEIIKSDEFKWISLQNFEPSNEYKKIFKSIESSKILGYNITRELMLKANSEFNKLKDKLSTYSSAFTGKLLADSLNEPSDGLYAFSKELGSIVRSSFAVKVQHKDLVIQIPSDQTLNWDVPIIKEAINLIEKIENFEQNKIKTFRSDFQAIYSDVIRKMIHPSIVSILARAQNIEDMPINTTTSSVESLLKKHAYNLNELGKYISRIIAFLDNYEEKGGTPCGFQDLIISQAIDLLKTADSLFELESPYAVDNDLFNDWKGDISPTFAGSRDPNSVKKYLSSQYSRVKFLAKEIASPAISILSLDIINNRISNINELQKWMDILGQIDEFEASKPGNSISSLENFITGIVSQSSLNEIKNDSAIAEISNQTGDYFINQKSKIAKALLNRAGNINKQKAYDSYNAIANYFNENIAGRFPFGNSSEDLSLESIEKFIKLYELNNVGDILNKKFIDKNEDVISFVENLPDIIQFFKIWLDHSKTTDQSNAIIGFKIENRVNKNNENYGSMILERSVFVNGFNTEDSDNLLIFHNGDNIEVKLPFVKSNTLDLMASGNNNMQINDRTVIFSYSGAWGIFGLIRGHKISKLDKIPSNGIILKFVVPVNNEDNLEDEARVFMKITPLIKNASGNWQTFSIPAFPSKAPLLQSDF